MKIVLAVVPRDETNLVLEALIAAGYTATLVESRGGMLRQSQYMLFIAVAETQVDNVLSIIRKSRREFDRTEKASGDEEERETVGALVLVWQIDQMQIL